MRAADPPLAPTPAEDIRALVADMPRPDTDAQQRARARDALLTKPPGSLGRLEDLAAWLAGWLGHVPPGLSHAAVRLFAGSHGITTHGVSAFPAAVTEQMLHNLDIGGAAINQLCIVYGLDLDVVDLGCHDATHDFTQQPAMSTADLLTAFRRGRESVPTDAQVLGIGELGIGNTTAAAAIHAALWGGAARTWVGRGTGLDDAGLVRKAIVVDAALQRHRDHLDDPVEVLRRLGGREIAAIAGAILQARTDRIPVVLDGFVTTSAAAVLHALDPSTLDHCVAGHVSAEAAHARVLQRLGLEPVLDLGLRLGEGTGAAVAIGVLGAAVATHTGMATFEDAGVSTGTPRPLPSP